MSAFHTSLRGTCLLRGQHPAGSRFALECPVLKAQERAKSASEGRDSGSRESTSASPGDSGTSGTISRRIAAGRAFRPGRPPLPLAEKFRRRRERDRKRRQGASGALAAGVMRTERRLDEPPDA